MDTISPAPTRTAAGQFAPGCSGNPKGRPIGSRNRASVMAEMLETGEPETLIRKYADIAHQGDKVALRFCVGRLVPPVRGRTIVLDLPPGAELDFRAGYTRVLRAVCDGEITPEEGVTMAELLTIGKAKLYLAPLPEAAPDEDEEEDEEDEDAPWTDREVWLLRELARMRMRMDAAGAASTPGATGAAPAAPPDAAAATPAASPPPPSVAAEPAPAEKRPDEASPVTPPAAAPAPPPQRRHFGTIVRHPEVLAAKLAIV
jgi:hypothetical protein